MSFVQRRNRKTKYCDSVGLEKTFSTYAVNLENESAPQTLFSSNFVKIQSAPLKESASVFPLMKKIELSLI